MVVELTGLEGRGERGKQRSRSEEVECGFGLGPGSAWLGRVREGWRQGSPKVSRVLAGLGLWSCGRGPWPLGVKQVAREVKTSEG